MFTEQPYSQRILVVDDEPLMRKFLTVVLSSSGYSVTEGEDGANALLKLQGDSYDLVLTDLAMPNMNGLELLEHIASEHTTVVTIMMTGSLDSQVSDLAEQKGVFDIILKPFRVEELLSTVQRGLECCHPSTMAVA